MEDDESLLTASEIADAASPSNWLTIPDLGVFPASVDWRGFSGPILYRGAEHREIRVQIRDLLAAARRLAKGTFTTLAELHQSRLDCFASYEKAAAAGQAETWSAGVNPREQVALRYHCITADLQRTLDHLDAWDFKAAVLTLGCASVWLTRFSATELKKVASEAPKNLGRLRGKQISQAIHAKKCLAIELAEAYLQVRSTRPSRAETGRAILPKLQETLGRDALSRNNALRTIDEWLAEGVDTARFKPKSKANNTTSSA